MTVDFAIYQLLGYITEWDTDNARFFWKRLAVNIIYLNYKVN